MNRSTRNSTHSKDCAELNYWKFRHKLNLSRILNQNKYHFRYICIQDWLALKNFNSILSTWHGAATASLEKSRDAAWQQARVYVYHGMVAESAAGPSAVKANATVRPSGQSNITASLRRARPAVALAEGLQAALPYPTKEPHSFASLLSQGSQASSQATCCLFLSLCLFPLSHVYLYTPRQTDEIRERRRTLTYKGEFLVVNVKFNLWCNWRLNWKSDLKIRGWNLSSI